MLGVFEMIPVLMILVFVGLLLYITRKQLGVSSFHDYATASNTIQTMGITFGVLATWYVGASFTAWAGFAVGFGFIAYYVTPYAIITLVVMYLVAERTYIWGKKYNCETQGELLGTRYRSRWVRAITGLAGALFSVPWLLMEWWTQGYVLSYATNGAISPFWGMFLGVFVVIFYVSMGGMRSVITANILQGLYMFFIGTGVMVWMIYAHFDGFGPLIATVAAEYPAALTYPGEAWDPPTAYWTSIIVTSGLAGFMWPWVYNKLFAADSLKTIKQSTLLAPILGTVFYAVFVLLGLGLHTLPEFRANPQEAFLAFFTEAGAVPLGLLVVLITAASLGTVSGILNAMSTAISNDVSMVINNRISRDTALKIARWTVVVMGFVALAGAAVQEGLLIFWALLTYQGMIMLFPVVLLGLYWRRANKEGALVGFIAGTVVAMGLYLTKPAFIAGLGWSEGVYGLIVCLALMVIFGYLKPEADHVQSMWEDIAEARRTKKVEKVTDSTLEY